MANILEALAVIKGKDATGNAFEQVAQKISRLAKAANALNRDVGKQMSMANNVERSAARLSRASNAIGGGLKAAGAGVAAYEGSRAVQAIVHETLKVAAERGHEETRMRASGMSASEVKEAGELAGEISKKYPSISQTEMMHTARNVRSMVGTYEEATKILEPLARLRVVALGAHPEKAEELNEDFDKLVKGMEIKGVTQDMPKFEHYITNMAKALNVFGDTLRPTDYYEMFKYGRASTNALSDQFMLETAPTLAQELGGSSAGKALSSFHTQFVGGKMSNKSVDLLNQYGFIDPSKVIKTKTGNVKGVLPGGITVGREFLTPGHEDPYAWTQAAVEQLHKKGVTDPAKIQEVLTAISSQATTAQMLTIFATQQKRIHKDWDLVRGAQDDKEAAAEYQKNDPKVIGKSIGAQIDNYLGNTASPFLPKANAGMNWFASGMSYMAEEAKKNPVHSAAQLGTAAALAAALGIDSGSAMLTNAGSLFRGEGAAGLKFPATKLVGQLLAPILDIATRPDMIKATPEWSKFAGLHEDKFGALADLDDSEKAAAIYGDNDPLYMQQLRARNAARRSAIESDLTNLGYGPLGLPGQGQMASQWSTADIQKATGIGSTEPVKAEVVGNATLETKVTVEPSPDFLTRVQTTVQNAINAFKSTGTSQTGTAGSTGRAMPEAGPPQ